MTHRTFDLTGKTAVVTGGNSGIGLAMALALARAGAGVCIWGTNEARNEVALAALRSTGVEARALRCDVGDEAAVDAAFADTVRHFGRVDACFANAGVIGSGTVTSFAEMTASEWRRVMRVNLDGSFYTARAAARHMTAHGLGGALVLTSSISAVSGAPRNQHYAASKGALVSMMYGLAVELARHRIRVNAIQPGWTHTPMVDTALDSRGFVERVLPRVPMRRWAHPEDFGGIAVYLASDASAYHTGDTFVIDGGYTKF